MCNHKYTIPFPEVGLEMMIPCKICGEEKPHMTLHGYLVYQEECRKRQCTFNFKSDKGLNYLG